MGRGASCATCAVTPHGASLVSSPNTKHSRRFLSALAPRVWLDLRRRLEAAARPGSARCWTFWCGRRTTAPRSASVPASWLRRAWRRCRRREREPVGKRLAGGVLGQAGGPMGGGAPVPGRSTVLAVKGCRWSSSEQLGRKVSASVPVLWSRGGLRPCTADGMSGVCIRFMCWWLQDVPRREPLARGPTSGSSKGGLEVLHATASSKGIATVLSA
jgi:hypothetical protein